jgi:hypothetical protein
LVVVRFFCFGLNTLPFWHKSPKRMFEWNISPFMNYYLPLWQIIWVKIIPKDGVMLGATAKEEWWSGVEAFVFAEDSNSLSIHLWLGLKFTWKHISHSIYKRDMIEGIFMSYVCKTSKEIPGIKNIELMPKFGKSLFI